MSKIRNRGVSKNPQRPFYGPQRPEADLKVCSIDFSRDFERFRSLNHQNPCIQSRVLKTEHGLKRKNRAFFGLISTDFEEKTLFKSCPVFRTRLWMHRF